MFSDHMMENILHQLGFVGPLIAHVIQHVTLLVSVLPSKRQKEMTYLVKSDDCD